ncbi:SAF domain-containing protein [Aeromicrobium sp.]|uniref:SAF domain-containing protein n=1 Tax=Aeromicrobium sp. TaxID=1871063 RepID=UPI0030C4CF73
MAKSTANQATASRLPSTRESRPALIGLAILLIFGGALASAWLAIQSGDRSYFVQVNSEVAQGATISQDDLTRVSLPEGFEGGIPSSESDSVVGKAAGARLLPGTVLMRTMISGKSGVEANQTQLTVAVDSSPFIRGLQSGAQLALDVGTSDGGERQTVYAELVSVGDEQSGSIGGSGSGETSIVVSIDISCLSTVSQGIEDSAVTPALIGGSDSSAIAKTCGS